MISGLKPARLTNSPPLYCPGQSRVPRLRPRHFCPRQPYDRSRTGISTFNPCAASAQDYQAIDNRRFHIQTIACSSCAPKLSLVDEPGNLLAEKHEALREAIGQLQNGKIIAIKSIGGYQLLVDASHQQAVERLRLRKHRPQKTLYLDGSRFGDGTAALQDQCACGSDFSRAEANKFASTSAVAPSSNRCICWSRPGNRKKLAAAIKAVTTQPRSIMEVCGGQNHCTIKYGIYALLPEQINLIHGCPACVTPLAYIGNGHQPGSGFTERRAVAQDLLTACPYA